MSPVCRASRFAFLRASALFHHIRSLRERGTATLPLPFAQQVAAAAARELHSFSKKLTKFHLRFFKKINENSASFFQKFMKPQPCFKKNKQTNLDF
ncbi:hypothetical protein [Methanimicrococcus stummii]|uniref:hypothetical protein n=1 Tax=Methanimicrococcus stummii TaxID=3028294 RepID=UPI00292CBFFE|nr:hypothetical protein [Methanimicrococcus sp. Es2]